MREKLMRFVKGHSDIFNPIWARLNPVMQPNLVQIVSDFEEKQRLSRKSMPRISRATPYLLASGGSTLSYAAPIRKRLERLLADLLKKSASTQTTLLFTSTNIRKGSVPACVPENGYFKGAISPTPAPHNLLRYCR